MTDELTFIAAASPLTQAQNLIVNPSFETATGQPPAPTNWKSSSWGTNNAKFTYASDAHSGSKAGRIDITTYNNGDAKWLFDWVSVTGGAAYVYSDFYKSNVNTKLVAAQQRADGSVVYRTLGALPANQAWTPASVEVRPDNDCVRLAVYHVLETVGWVQLDDVLLSAAAAASLATGVPNGTFEQASEVDSNRPLAWKAASWGTNTVSFSYSSDAYEGSKAATVQLTSYSSGDAKWVFDSVPVTAGTNYVFRNYYKSNATTKVVAAFQRPDNSVVYLTLAAQVAPSATWSPFVASMTAPSGTSLVSVYHLIASTGTLSIDSVGISPGTLPDLSSGVPNGSVEVTQVNDTTRPMSWSTSQASTLSAQFAFASDAHSGSRAVSLSVSNYTGGDAKWYFDPQPITPGKRYRYSDYYKSTAASFVTARITRQNGSFQYLSLGSMPASAAYTMANASFLVPTDASAVTVFRGLSSNGSLTLDDAALSQLPDVPLVNGLPNGDLEQAAYPGANSPAAFRSNVWGTNNASFTYNDTGLSGTHSVGISVTAYTSGKATWYFEPQAIDPLKIYEYSDQYRSDADSEVQAQVTLDDGSTVNLTLPVALASPSWTKYRARIYLPTRATLLTVFHGLARVGTVSLDDVALQVSMPVAFQRGLVSLTFDDSWLSDYAQVLPVLDKHAVPATHYVITSLIGTENRLDLPMLQELRARGDEIAAHTATHPDLTTLSQTSLMQELQSSKDYLVANGFEPAANFASPYGAYNRTTLNAIETVFLSHRTTDSGYNARDEFDRFRLNCQNIRATTTVAEVDSWAARAAAERTWLIITYHDVADSGGGQYSTTAAALDAQLSAIKSYGLTIVTVQQALGELAPQLQSSAP